jgi:hypothetical protein
MGRTVGGREGERKKKGRGCEMRDSCTPAIIARKINDVGLITHFLRRLGNIHVSYPHLLLLTVKTSHLRQCADSFSTGTIFHSLVSTQHGGHPYTAVHTRCPARCVDGRCPSPGTRRSRSVSIQVPHPRIKEVGIKEIASQAIGVHHHCEPPGRVLRPCEQEGDE